MRGLSKQYRLSRMTLLSSGLICSKSAGLSMVSGTAQPGMSDHTARQKAGIRFRDLSFGPITCSCR